MEVPSVGVGWGELAGDRHQGGTHCGQACSTASGTRFRIRRSDGLFLRPQRAGAPSHVVIGSSGFILQVISSIPFARFLPNCEVFSFVTWNSEFLLRTNSVQSWPSVPVGSPRPPPRLRVENVWEKKIPQRSEKAELEVATQRQLFTWHLHGVNAAGCL